MNGSKEDAFQTAQGEVLEGGVFYPVGHIVAGISDHDQALRLQRMLCAGGREDDCILASADSVARSAASELGALGVISALGAGAQVRDKQLQLARQGCDFVIVNAPTNQDRDRVIRLLGQVPVRYAVRYGRLAIEDLIDHIPSATLDREVARKV